MLRLVERMLAGEVPALARLISLVEREAPQTPQVMKQIHPYLGKAHIVGITGPPGGGKSTLVDRLTRVARGRGLSVGIIAVDPTSPFSGGAVLGDRVRLQQHYLDPGVFIRSMATRGSRGGLPRTIRGVIKLLDAFGKDLILVETVGVGQTELDIVETADTVVVVLVPEAGDAIQALKAGLMEIASIFVVNKADLGGADRLALQLESMLRLSSSDGGWNPPIRVTQALNSVGIEEVYQALEEHYRHLQTTGELERRRLRQLEEELWQRVEQRVQERLRHLLQADGGLASLAERVASGELDPYTAAERIERELLSRGWPGCG